jgi:hypothetical protein
MKVPPLSSYLGTIDILPLISSVCVRGSLARIVLSKCRRSRCFFPGLKLGLGQSVARFVVCL